MINSIVEKYLDYLPNLLNYTTLSTAKHKSILNLWFTYLDTLGVSFLEAESEHVLSWIDYRQNEQNVKDSTISNGLCVLRTFYKYLCEQQIMEHQNPVYYLPDFVCKPPKEGDYLTIDECFSLLESIDIKSPIVLRNYTIIALMWSTGLRSRELLSLTWKDIDLDDGHLIVRKGKGKKQRQIFLSQRIKNDLLFYKQSMTKVEKNNFVFTATKPFNSTIKTERKLSTNRLFEIINTAAKNSGIKRNIGARTLRHTFATHMYEAGTSVDDLKEIMGHKYTFETTIYIHVTPEAAKNILAKHVSKTFEFEEEE